MPGDPSIATHPRVSVGLPVFNGARYIAAAIDSILGQSFTDLELIISDNASTDGTADICAAYAQRDPRVRYIRNAANIGAARNFNQTFEHARGEYFKWAAHDDVVARDFIARCVAALDADPSSVLCFSRVAIIDAAGKPTGGPTIDLRHVGSEDAASRFADLVLVDHTCDELFGVVRADVLRRTPLMRGYIASDRVLLAELGLRGRFQIVSDRLFFSRDHPERALRAAPFHRRAEWFDPANRGRRVFPHWRFFKEYFGSVARAAADRSTPVRCYLVLLRWPFRNLNWARLAADVVAAFVPRSLGSLLRLKSRLVKPRDARMARTVCAHDLYLLTLMALMALAAPFGDGRVRRTLGNTVAEVAYRLSRRKRNDRERALAAVLVDTPARERTAIVRSAFRQFWRDAFISPRSSQPATGSVVGLSHVHHALAAGRGVILWESSQFGSRTAAKRVLRDAGLHVCQVHADNHAGGFGDGRPATRFRQRFVEPFFDWRERQIVSQIVRVPVQERVGGRRTLLRLLADNQIVCIANDGVFGLRFVTAPFFERQRQIATGIATLARAAGATILPMFCVETGQAEWCVTIEPPLRSDKDDRDAAATDIATQYATLLESCIRRYPDQYRTWDALLTGPQAAVDPSNEVTV